MLSWRSFWIKVKFQTHDEEKILHKIGETSTKMFCSMIQYKDITVRVLCYGLEIFLDYICSRNGSIEGTLEILEDCWIIMTRLVVSSYIIYAWFYLLFMYTCAMYGWIICVLFCGLNDLCLDKFSMYIFHPYGEIMSYLFPI